jgi:L-fucose mutarotase/ribose pyranase (RbsD/FucU family)
MTILKGIPRIINPRLLYALARMGHGDELVGGAPSQCISCSVHPCALSADAAYSLLHQPIHLLCLLL